jgi:uncharacterized protein YoxC
VEPWQLIAVGCGVAITIALVALLVALTRVARRAEAVLTIVAQELRPVVGQVNGLTEDLRTLTRQTSDEVGRLGAITDRVTEVTDGLARMVSALGGLARAGQLVGMLAAVRKGVDVFVERFKQGDHHG